MKNAQYVIIGGGLAGQRACEGIREVDAEGSIVLITDEPHRPYQRPPLSKGYLRGKQGLDKVYLENEEYYHEKNVEVISGVHADAVDPEAHRLTLTDGQTLEYGKLLLATGGRARRLSVPGNDLPGVFTLRTIEDSDAIREAAQQSKHALVIGGSFIGSEVAASLAQLGLNVSMAFLESRLLERLVPEELSAWLQTKYEDNGINTFPNATLESLQGDGSVERAIISNDKAHTLEADLVVTGVGIRLNTELAQGAGLEMEKDDAVMVDAHLCTSDPDIYAAGDVAAWPDPTFGKRLRVEHWDVARQQGYTAGKNMAGEEQPYDVLPYFFSDLFDFSFEVWGDLSAWDQVVLRGSLEEGFAYYYFDEDKLTGVLTSGRPDEEREPMQAMVKARPDYDQVADKLSDETVALSDLL